MEQGLLLLTKNKIEIEFRSQSFLQQQVRSMVGCLKYVGEKKWTLKKREYGFLKRSPVDYNYGKINPYIFL